VRLFHVYILTNRSRTLYVGVTGDLARRMTQHRAREVPGFTATYRLDRLVYAEEFRWVQEALAREKQVKRWRRAKKVALIEGLNPEWEDLGWNP
jgi:putative endonuclease